MDVTLADKENPAPEWNRHTAATMRQWLEDGGSIWVSLSYFPNTIITALFFISLLPIWLLNSSSSSTLLQGPGSCIFTGSNILLSHRWLETMFWEFCMELQNGAVVGIMGLVNNPSCRVSSQQSLPLQHQQICVFYLYPPTSYFPTPSNRGCSNFSFNYSMLMKSNFFDSSSSFFFSLLLDFLTLLFPKVLSFPS